MDAEKVRQIAQQLHQVLSILGVEPAIGIDTPAGEQAMLRLDVLIAHALRTRMYLAPHSGLTREHSRLNSTQVFDMLGSATDEQVVLAGELTGFAHIHNAKLAAIVGDYPTATIARDLAEAAHWATLSNAVEIASGGDIAQEESTSRLQTASKLAEDAAVNLAFLLSQRDLGEPTCEDKVG